MRRQLDLQADAIEAILACHKIPAWVVGGRVTPRFVRFEVSTGPSVRIRRVTRLGEELALHLGVASCRIYRCRGHLRVEIPRPGGQVVRCVPLVDRLARQSPRPAPCSALLGLDGDGSPLLVRLPSPDVAHILVAGTTGSGKTALVRSMLVSLAHLNPPRALRMVLLDPKGRGFRGLDAFPHLLEPPVVGADEAVPVLERLVQEMERRDGLHQSEPRLVVALDELADLMLVGGRDAEAALTRLVQRGREAGIHLIACTQKPTVAAVGSLIKSNFPVRLVGAVASPEDAKVAAGIAGTGAERLLGRGDFLLVVKGQTRRFQAAYATEAEIAAVVARLRTATLRATGTGA